jgi:hypothetical protein
MPRVGATDAHSSSSFQAADDLKGDLSLSFRSELTTDDY